MRLALISDIHGNAIALEAVLDDIAQQKVDRIVCLGDVATVGPQPREVFDILLDLDADYILGNHDAALLKLDLVDELNIAPILHSSMIWCEGQMTSRDRNFLMSFIPHLEVQLAPGHPILCFHGSPQSNTEILLSTTPDESIDRIFNGHPQKLLAGGHTHVQMMRQHFGAYLINPGSVGNGFCAFPEAGAEPLLLPWAEYGIVQVDEKGLSIDLRRVDYDLQKMKSVLSTCALPVKSWLIEQFARAEAGHLCGQGAG